MAFFRNKKKEINPGGAVPIANSVPYNPGDPPLDGGDAYVTKKLMQELPIELGNKVIKSRWDSNNSKWDNKDNPNLFELWADIYETFIGSYMLTKAPDEILDHERTILHHFFLYDKVALLKFENKWLVGSYSSTHLDNYGNVIEGIFNPWNQGLNSEKNPIHITKKNNVDFINASLSNFGIPIFLKIGYFIRLKRLIYMFKRSNLGFSILKKILFLESNGQEVLIKYLNDIFNQGDDDFIAPIQVMNASSRGTGKNRTFQFNIGDIDGANQIDLKFDYQGILINGDIEGLNKEIFRIAGLRTDLVSRSGEYQERSTSDQVKQSTSYFDARERYILLGLNKFSREFKRKFNLEMKWESIYKVEKQADAIREKELGKEKKDEASAV